MGSPNSLLKNARALARDFPRDSMPPGYLWDVVDYVPTIIDTNLTGRGGWLWGSAVMTGDVEAGIYANFSSGDKGLVQTTDGRLFEVDPLPGVAVHDRGALPRAKQNPVQLVDTVIHFDKASTMTPRLITAPGGVVAAPVAANAAHKFSPVGCVYKSMLVTGGAPGEIARVRFSVPGGVLTDAASYDSASWYDTTLPITAIAALRSVILVFHAGSVERFRGALPIHTGGAGDMQIESLFDRAGCVDPQTIAYWNDNCVFADEHGVHVTDGSVLRNLASQGGILTLWRTLYEFKQTICATTFLDYYIITVRRTDGVVMTLVCDLNKRQWFRFSNIPALCYIASSGGGSMERFWAGLAGKARLARLGPCFFPTFTTAQIQDDDGTPVLPVFETPWYRMGQEGRKRARFAYLSYDARAPGDSPAARDGSPSGWRFGGEEDGPAPAALNELALRSIQQTLRLSYIRSPQQGSYTTLGDLPSTREYSRYRLPLGQNPYGVAFKVQQLLPTTVTRIFDLAVEAQAGERSRA